MPGQGNIKLINATELNLDYQVTLIPNGGNDYPLKVSGIWETRNCPYSSGVGLVTDLRNPWIRQANGVPLQIGSPTGPSQFGDTAPIFAYVTKHPSNNDTIIAWSPTGRMVDPESGYEVMAGDPNYLLIGGMRPIGGKFVYNASIQNMSSRQHPKPYDWTAVYGAGLPSLGTNWQEPDSAARVGVFIWDDRSALFRFKGGFQGTQVGASIYSAFRFNPPAWQQGAVVSPSGTENDALPIVANGQAFNLGIELGMKAHGPDLYLMTVVAYCTASGGRVNQGQTGVFGEF